MWAMHRFGVHLVDSVMARAALVSDEGEVPPEWVLHVGAVTDAQVGTLNTSSCLMLMAETKSLLVDSHTRTCTAA